MANRFSNHNTCFTTVSIYNTTTSKKFRSKKSKTKGFLNLNFFETNYITNIN